MRKALCLTSDLWTDAPRGNLLKLTGKIQHLKSRKRHLRAVSRTCGASITVRGSAPWPLLRRWNHNPGVIIPPMPRGAFSWTWHFFIFLYFCDGSPLILSVFETSWKGTEGYSKIHHTSWPHHSKQPDPVPVPRQTPINSAMIFCFERGI